MAKNKKKRTKRYSGEDAARPIQPTIHRVNAVDRGKVGQWWFEKKKAIRTSATIGAVLLLVIWLLVALISLFV